MIHLSIFVIIKVFFILYWSGYRGTVRRVLGSTNPVWFEASSPRECEDVPDQVNAGKPPRDICATVSIQLILHWNYAVGYIILNSLKKR